MGSFNKSNSVPFLQGFTSRPLTISAANTGASEEIAHYMVLGKIKESSAGICGMVLSLSQIAIVHPKPIFLIAIETHSQ